MSNTTTKRRKVMNYLSNGKGLTPREAKSRFGVGNLRATISDIKSQVECFGNWEITTESCANGSTRYSMQDTHPGTRMYGFANDGSRFMIDNG